MPVTKGNALSPSGVLSYRPSSSAAEKNRNRDQFRVCAATTASRMIYTQRLCGRRWSRMEARGFRQANISHGKTPAASGNRSTYIRRAASSDRMCQGHGKALSCLGWTPHGLRQASRARRRVDGQLGDCQCRREETGNQIPFELWAVPEAWRYRLQADVQKVTGLNNQRAVQARLMALVQQRMEPSDLRLLWAGQADIEMGSRTGQPRVWAR